MMPVYRPSTPPSFVTQNAGDNDGGNDGDDDDGDGALDNFDGSPRFPLHSQLQFPQQMEEEQLSIPLPLPNPLEPPLTPLALYPRQPRDESEAREVFRRGAIDKAHETSALSWVEHIQNHDIHRFRNSIKRRPRNNSNPDQNFRSQSTSPLFLSEGGPTPTSTSEAEDRLLLFRSSHSFHTVSALSTLRKKRRSSSYNDLNQAISAPTPVVASSIPVVRRSSASKADNRNIEIVARSASTKAAKKDVESKGLPTNELPISSRERTNKKKGTRKKRKIEGLATWEKYCNRHVQLMISLALFSFLGQFARYFIELAFGKACHEPGWELKWTFCTSSPGTTESKGGAFFTDLPTNIIGCFLMGLLVSGDGESISVNLPLAALPRNHYFQNLVVTHVGLRTGFCGALTTFASWNTQMVIMLCGGRKATALGYSQWMSVIWGYVVGFYASLQSYQFGVAVAFCLSRWYNPHLAKEADMIIDKKAIGVLIHRGLPDFERRFLHEIILESQHAKEESHEGKMRENLLRYGESCYESYYNDHIHHLNAWKESTDNHRSGFQRVSEDSASKNYVSELHELEKNLLVDRTEPRQELLEIARDAGWDVRALKNWTSALTREEQRLELVGMAHGGENTGSNSEESDGKSNADSKSDCEHSTAQTHLEDAYFASSYSSVTEVVITSVCFLVITGLLFAGFFHYSNIIIETSDTAVDTNEPEQMDTLVASNYRTQFLSSLLSPLGTYARWYLSRLNGSLHNEKWEWLPIGTLLANLIASSISALCAGVLLGMNNHQTLTPTFVKAVQVGFAGSCSTVSTYCTETTGLLRALPRAFWGYYYGFGSMICTLLVAVCSYFWAVI